MNRRNLFLAGAAAGVALATQLAGCALPARAPTTGPRWSGRLALTVEGQASQSFTAGFDLSGSPQEGELELFTPLGGTAALLRWAPGNARLLSPGRPDRTAPSLEALLVEATGTALPVAALFDWLAGIPTTVEGWQADLSHRADGRLQARRLTNPQADLRLVLEQP